jgi:hypothetical protein
VVWGVLRLHDNAPVHKSCKALAATRVCGFEPWNYPLCSPNLAPGDYVLFWNLKKHLRGGRFLRGNEFKGAVL